MKDIKLKMRTEIGAQPGKKGPNQPELEVKSEAKLKNTNNKRKEGKRREEKTIKRGNPLIEVDKDKNGFLDYKDISGKNSNYKGKKGNTKKDNINDNKRNRINKKKNTYLIITLIFFNLIISNNNIIEIDIF